MRPIVQAHVRHIELAASELPDLNTPTHLRQPLDQQNEPADFRRTSSAGFCALPALRDSSTASEAASAHFISALPTLHQPSTIFARATLSSTCSERTRSYHTIMPFVTSARQLLGVRIPDTSVHEDASGSIVSLSWAFLVIPCIFLVGAFGWILYNFSQPSEFPQSNGFGHADNGADDEDDMQGDDEKEQLLDAFRESQAHTCSTSASADAASTSAWKINSRFSTTSRGGFNGTHSPSSSPKAKRLSLGSRSVGSKAAKVLAYNRDRMMQDLENVDPLDRQELQRSSSRASEARKSD